MVVFFWELSVSKKCLVSIVQGGPKQFLVLESCLWYSGDLERIACCDDIKLECVDCQRMCNWELWLWIVAGSPSMFFVESGVTTMNNI